jgi:hypothetical protein
MHTGVCIFASINHRSNGEDIRTQNNWPWVTRNDMYYMYRQTPELKESDICNKYFPYLHQSAQGVTRQAPTCDTSQ